MVIALIPCGSITFLVFFFFNDTATTEIYTLSLHDALPISDGGDHEREHQPSPVAPLELHHVWRSSVSFAARGDRKSTRLNSSHVRISYAVFCLKKKKIVTRVVAVYYFAVEGCICANHVARF